MKPFEVFDVQLHAIFVGMTFFLPVFSHQIGMRNGNVYSSLFTQSLFISSSKTETQRCYHAHHEWAIKKILFLPDLSIHTYESRSLKGSKFNSQCIKQNHKTFCSFWFKWIVQFFFRWLTLDKCLSNAFAVSGQYAVA